MQHELHWKEKSVGVRKIYDDRSFQPQGLSESAVSRIDVSAILGTSPKGPVALGWEPALYRAPVKEYEEAKPLNISISTRCQL